MALRYKILIAMLVMCFSVIGFLVGYRVYIPSGEEVITTDEALKMLEEARYTHEYYVNKTTEYPEAIGDKEFHAMWVKRYNQIEDVIKRLANDN